MNKESQANTPSKVYGEGFTVIDPDIDTDNMESHQFWLHRSGEEQTPDSLLNRIARIRLELPSPKLDPTTIAQFMLTLYSNFSLPLLNYSIKVLNHIPELHWINHKLALIYTELAIKRLLYAEYGPDVRAIGIFIALINVMIRTHYVLLYLKKVLSERNSEAGISNNRTRIQFRILNALSAPNRPSSNRNTK